MNRAPPALLIALGLAGCLDSCEPETHPCLSVVAPVPAPEPEPAPEPTPEPEPAPPEEHGALQPESREVVLARLARTDALPADVLERLGAR